MREGELLNNSIKRVFIGAVFLIVGVIFGYLADNRDEILIPADCQSVPIPNWCQPILIAFSEFGIKSVAYSFIFIGSILIVLYDYVAGLLGRVLSFAIGHVANAKHVVLESLSMGVLPQDDVDQIIRTSFARYTGQNDPLADSMGQHIIDRILKQNKKDGGFWRKNYSSYITVDKLTEHASVPIDRYLCWRETVSFSLCNTRKNTAYHHESHAAYEVSLAHLNDVVSSTRYDVSIDNKKIFSLSDYISEIDFGRLGAGDKFERDGMELSYSAGLLSIAYRKVVSIDQFEVEVVVDEESFVSIDDPVYELHMFEPYRGARIRFKIDKGFCVYHVGLSEGQFGNESVDGVAVWHDSNHVRLDSRHWCMPGIVAILLWKPNAD